MALRTPLPPPLHPHGSKITINGDARGGGKRKGRQRKER